MKFNQHLSPEVEELLTTQYKKYIKETVMTQKEMRALREWVKEGHSVYENTCGAWADGQMHVEFLAVYRDEENIRQHTKGISPEETRKFAMDYSTGTIQKGAGFYLPESTCRLQIYRKFNNNMLGVKVIMPIFR